MQFIICTDTQKHTNIFQSVFHTFHCFHFSFHPPISPSIPIQSLQSAVRYRIPLQPSDAALQRRENCMCVERKECVNVQLSVSEIFLLHTENLIIRHTTVMSPASIYPAVCANCFCFFPDVECAVSNFGLAQKWRF